MKLPEIIWIIATWINLTIYSLVSFVFVSKIFNFKHNWLLFILASAANALSGIITLGLSIDITLMFALLYFGLLLEFLVIYRASLSKTLFITATISFQMITHIFLAYSIMALFWEISIYTIAHDPLKTMQVFNVGIFSVSIASYILSKAISIPKIQVILDRASQRNFQTIWISICFIYLLFNGQIFNQDVSLPYIYYDQILKIITLILGVYIMLLYNFKVCDTLNYKTQNEQLRSTLKKNLAFLEIMTGEKNFKFEINLTKNLFRMNIFTNDEDNSDTWGSYGEMLKILMKEMLVKDDFDKILSSMSRDTLLELYHNGIKEKSWECRIRSTKSDWRWSKLQCSIIADDVTGDVLAFGYMLDIHDSYEDSLILKEKAEIDLMTGLYNRATFETLVRVEFHKKVGILLMIDADNFKSINDEFGHSKGDEVLKQIAHLLKITFRESDLIGRFGGDEFLVYITNTTDVSKIKNRIDKILIGGKMSFKKSDGGNVSTSLSVGAAVVAENVESLEQLFEMADTALYRVKNTSKGHCIVFGENVKI